MQKLKDFLAAAATVCLVAIGSMLLTALLVMSALMV